MDSYNTETNKNIWAYYLVLGAALILVLLWYFFLYPNRNLPAKLPAIRVAPSQEVLNRYSAPGTMSKKTPDTIMKKYTAPTNTKPAVPPPQSIMNSFSASSGI